MTYRPLLAMLAAVLALATTAVPAFAGTPEQDLAWLNAKRAANGIPGDITLNPDWSASCAQHVHYMRQTNTVVHPEDPASPYYTDAGNWAGTHAVLASTETWTADNFIWETAPLHLAQLLNPELAQVGIADDGTFVCVTTWPGYIRPAPSTNTVVTYPGNGTSTYAREFAAEWPTTPSQALGVPDPTGPHLYVYDWGPASNAGITASGQVIGIASSTLTGPDGPVPVRWVDASNPVVGPYMEYASGIIIPTHPLLVDRAYRATVTFNDGTSYGWAFSTGLAAEELALRDVHFTPTRTTRRRSCAHRHGARCATWRTTYRQTLLVRGLYADADLDTDGGSPGYVGVTYRGVEQAQLRVKADGSFSGRYVVTSRRRSFDLPVTLTAGDDIAGYVVHFRIRYAGGRPVSQVYNVERVPTTTLGARVSPTARP